MPSSLIFVGLVVLWLLILVPTVARRRQEVARPSKAALSGRVLQRQQASRPARRRTEEVDDVNEVGSVAGDVPAQRRGAAGAGQGADAHGTDAARVHGDDATDAHGADAVDVQDDDAIGAREGEAGDVIDGEAGDARDAGARMRAAAAGEYGDPLWERPVPRYRPGRGGFDPAAAALAARARYSFRQRIVLTLLVAAVVTGVAAVLVAPMLWWVHGPVDVALVGYLVYLRRQVRMEETIRERRAARMAGTRRPAAAEDPNLDEWARRVQEALASSAAASEDLGTDDPAADDGQTIGDVVPAPFAAQAPEPEVEDVTPALPRLQSAATPSLPAGTALVGVDDLDPDLPAVDRHAQPDYRRAAGQ